MRANDPVTPPDGADGADGTDEAEEPEETAPPAPQVPHIGDSACVASVSESVAVRTAARAIAAVDVDALSDDECLGVLDDVELAQRSLAAVAMTVAARVEVRGLCDRRYGTATHIWYERRHRRSRINVGRQIRTGVTLWRHFPELLDALGEGAISVERVEFIVSKVNDRNAEALTAAQGALLALSRAEPSYQRFCVLVDDLARYADPDGGHDPNPAADRVSLRRAGNELSLTAMFCGPVGETVEHLLEGETNRLWRQWRTDVKNVPDLAMPSRTEIRAQALVELIRRGNLIPSNDSGLSTADAADPDAADLDAVGPDPRGGSSAAALARTELTLIIDADRADGLDPLLAAALNHAGFGPLPAGVGYVAGGDHLGPGHLGAGHLVGQPVTGPSGARTRFSAQQWQLLMCTADVSEVLLDRLGMPTAVRHRDRFPNRAMRRSLVARDGGCAFPGCEAPPAWTDAHHVIEYDAPGDTVSHNLVLLCRPHHNIVHRSGWSVTHNPGATAIEGYFTITTALGYTLGTQHRRRPTARHSPSPEHDPTTGGSDPNAGRQPGPG